MGVLGRMDVLSLYWTRGRHTGVMTFRYPAGLFRMVAAFHPETRYRLSLEYHG